MGNILFIYIVIQLNHCYAIATLNENKIEKDKKKKKLLTKHITIMAFVSVSSFL